jgi:hypothetical protein
MISRLDSRSAVRNTQMPALESRKKTGISLKNYMNTRVDLFLFSGYRNWQMNSCEKKSGTNSRSASVPGLSAEKPSSRVAFFVGQGAVNRNKSIDECNPA